MSDGVFLDGEDLEMNDPPRLSWVRARDAVNLLWRENPKLHDLQQIVESELAATAAVIGLGEREAAATIRSGIEAGMKEPRRLVVEDKVTRNKK